MKTWKYLLLLTSVMLFTTSVYAQRSFLTYRQLGDIQKTSPSALRTGLFGFDNPALLNYNVSDFDAMLILSDPNNNQFDFNRWGLFWGSDNVGYGAFTQKAFGHAVTDYRYSVGFGDRVFGLGITYGFVGGAKSYFGRSNTLGWGFLYRPAEFLSISGMQTYALSDVDAESAVDIAVRPVKNIPVTVFADYAMFHDQNLKDGTWSVGASVEALEGIRVNGRYFDNKSLAVSVDVSLYTIGFGAQSGFNDNGDNTYKSYTLRLGGPDRSIFKDMFVKPHWATMTLSGNIKYQKYKWFDNSTTLSSLLFKLDEAIKDKNIIGLAIDGRQLSGSMETLWEIRDKLKEFKNSGKKIVIFMERPSMTSYYLASVADKVILDPMGSVSVSGFAMGRSYYKKMLDKIGIGFDEIRLFKYKSAVENFARDTMSEGDREQRQKMIDDWYDIIKQDISKSRNISNEEFDKIVDGSIIYLAKDAMSNKLIDTTARWQDLEKILSTLTPQTPNYSSLFKPIEYVDPIDDKWGVSKKDIALIYVVGDCSMEEGIKARNLIGYVEWAAKNDNVKAIVLRVDSPGGDAMASDYIAEVVRKYKDKKPIIVSQGSVAASGGYWLSMDASSIVSSPVTITGSIGVISSWIYDKGLKDSLGISTSIVKHGKYSDLGTSYQLPLIPIGLPLRNLNQDERNQFEGTILSLYTDFVTKVSTARNKSYNQIDSVAQGRVWTGRSAKEIGLVDELGGLSTAIKLAKDKANIGTDDDVNIYEFPKQELFDLSSLFSNMFGIDSGISLKESDLNNIIYRLKNNGTPMPILPIDYLEMTK